MNFKVFRIHLTDNEKVTPFFLNFLLKIFWDFQGKKISKNWNNSKKETIF